MSDFFVTRIINKNTKHSKEDKMIVSDLVKMQKIVDSRSDLNWIGWDVVKYKQVNHAQFRKDGVFKDGVWKSASVFPLTEKGWNVPNSIIDANV